MRNIFLFIILTHFSPLVAHSLPNNVISDCNLPAPTNLQAVETGPSYAIMSWDAVPGAAGYLVRWFNASGAQINADTTLDTEFEVQGLVPGETYDFRVAAVCVSGEPSVIFAPIIVVPIVTELVISTDNPLGNLVETCSQPINPVAECVFDFNLSKSFIGKVKLSDLNQVYYFRIRYSDHEFKGGNSKVLLDLIKPHFYTETPVPNPKLFTEYGDSIGMIYAYGSARKQKIEFLQIIITKIKNTSYKISVYNMININSNMEFSFFSPNIFELSDGTESDSGILINNYSEKSKADIIKYVSVFNLTGTLVTEFETDLNEDYHHLLDLLRWGVKRQKQSIFWPSRLFFLCVAALRTRKKTQKDRKWAFLRRFQLPTATSLLLNELPSGIYILRIRHDKAVFSKKIMVSNYK